MFGKKGFIASVVATATYLLKRDSEIPVLSLRRCVCMQLSCYTRCMFLKHNSDCQAAVYQNHVDGSRIH